MGSAFWIKFTTIFGILGAIGTLLTLVGSYYLQLANKIESDRSTTEIKQKVLDVGDEGITEVRQTKETIIGRLQMQGDSIEKGLREKSEESMSRFNDLNQELATATGKLKQQLSELQNSTKETQNQITGGDNYAHVAITEIFNHNHDSDGYEWQFFVAATNQGDYPIKDIFIKLRERSREAGREDILLFEGKIPNLNKLAAPLAKGQILELDNSNSIGLINIKVPLHRREYIFVADIEQSNRRVTETTIFKKVNQGPRGDFWYRATEITDVASHKATYNADPEFPPDGPNRFINYSSAWEEGFKEISSETEWKMGALDKTYPDSK